MGGERSKDGEPAAPRDETEKSKGQYGGLDNLGPGGGSDIEDAAETEDIHPETDQPPRGRR